MKNITIGSFKETLDRYQQYQRFLPYLVLGLVILLTVSVFNSGWDRIGRLRESNQQEEERILLLKTRVNQIESISTTEIENRIKDVVFAFPRVIDPILILSSAKMLAMESNLLIDEITFSPGEIRKDKGDNKRSVKTETISINFSLQGFEDDIKQFVEKANRRSPLISLTNLDLEFGGGEGGAILVKITGDTFVAPVDSSKFSEKTEVTLQTEEDLLYQKVKALEKVGTSPIAEGAEFVKFDEDRDPFTYGSDQTTLPQPE